MDSHLYTSQALESHDVLVEAVREVAKRASVADVADAFVGSLRSGSFEYWSALASLSLARALPKHAFRSDLGRRRCAVCSTYLRLDSFQGELFKSLRKKGVISLEMLRYTLYDLESFLSDERPKPQPEDSRLFDSMICKILDLSLSDSVREAEKAVGPSLTKGSAWLFLGALGACGVLASRERPGFWPSFVKFEDWADLDPGRYTYPVAWWKRKDGVNLAALEACKLGDHLSKDTISRLRSSAIANR